MNNYAIHYGQVRLDEHGRLDVRDPFQWQSRVTACKQQVFHTVSRSERSSTPPKTWPFFERWQQALNSGKNNQVRFMQRRSGRGQQENRTR